MQSWQVLAASKTITIHNSQSDSLGPVAEYNPHRGIVNCAVYNHTGKVIASCGQDGKVALHSAQRCQDKLLELTYHSASEQPSSINCCLFSPKSKYIGAGSANSTVKIWDMKSTNKDKQLLHKLKGHSGGITSLGWVNCEQIIASSSTSGDILLHDLATGAIRQSLSSRLQQGINNIKVSEGEGFKRLGACTNSGSLMVWDLNVSVKKPIYTYEDAKKSSFTCLSISYFSPQLMVCSSIDSNFFFVDVNERKVIKNICTDEPLTSIAFNDDGQILIAGGISGGLMIYDLRKIQSPLLRLTGHDTPIKSVCFSEKEKEKDKERIKGKEKQIGNPTTFSRTSSSNPSSEVEIQKQQKNKALTPVLSSNKLVQEEEKLVSKGVRNLTKKEEVVVKPAVEQRPMTLQQPANTTDSQISTVVPSRVIQSSSTINIGSSAVQTPYGRVGTSQIISPAQDLNQPQLKILQDRLLGEMKSMEMRLNEKFEMLHLQVIRQMQLSVEKMTACFDKKNSTQRQLQSKIRQLQEENESLKRRTY